MEQSRVEGEELETRTVLYIYISLPYAFYFQVTLGALTFQVSAIQDCFLKSW